MLCEVLCPRDSLKTTSDTACCGHLRVSITVKLPLLPHEPGLALKRAIRQGPDPVK
jgi:hypothetical protein